MNTATTIAIVAGLLLVTGLFSKSQALHRLIFYPKTLKGIHLEGINPVMTLGLAVQNTSNQSATFNSIAGELYANDYLIGNISTFTPQLISPNAETIIYIDAVLFPITIVSDIINSIKNKTFTHTLELDSTANVDNLQVPVDLTFKFGK